MTASEDRTFACEHMSQARKLKEKAGKSGNMYTNSGIPAQGPPQACQYRSEGEAEGPA